MARMQNERGGRDRRDEGPDLVEKLVAINRVAKVVKGGRRFGFSAIVVVGDGNGRAGYGLGKAREVPEAIRKATDQARKDMIRVPLREGRTLHHDINGRYGAGRVSLRNAPQVPVLSPADQCVRFSKRLECGCRCEVDRHIECAQYGEGDFPGVVLLCLAAPDRRQAW